MTSLCRAAKLKKRRKSGAESKDQAFNQNLGSLLNSSTALLLHVQSVSLVVWKHFVQANDLYGPIHVAFT